MKDITETLKDIASTDRVFKVDDKFIKVRIVRRDPPPGSPSFGAAFLTISGSETGKDGRALPLGDGYRIAEPVSRTIQSGGNVDVAALIQQYREECVTATLLAAEAQQQFDQLL